MKAKIVGLIGMACTFLPLALSAQTSLSVPNEIQNIRFYSDVFNIQRPALSISGFDDGGDHSKGYGLKQILEMLYTGSADLLMVNTYNQIIDISKQNLYDPFNPPSGHYTTNPLSIVNDNSNILQSRAFVALARYVLYKNGIISQIPDSSQIAPPHNVALSDLKSAFLKPDDWLLANTNHKDDQVKWTRTAGNYARALDLYLALENAFYYYGGNDREEYNDQNSTVLLSKSQKKDVILRLASHLNALDSYLYSDAVAFSGVQNYEAEPGNRPMKMFLAMGYGALTLQNYEPSTQSIPNTASNYLQKAFRSAGLQESQNSTC